MDVVNAKTDLLGDQIFVIEGPQQNAFRCSNALTYFHGWKDKNLVFLHFRLLI